MKEKKVKKKRRLILGADPGKDGAIALLYKSNGKLFKMYKTERVNKSVDWVALDSFIKKYADRIDHAFLEKPNSGGGFSGRTQSIGLGDSIGTFRTMLLSNQLRLTMVPPGTWQKVCFQGIEVMTSPKKETKEEKASRKALKKKKPAPKVKDNKAMAYIAATRLFPGANFVPDGSRKPFDGWVDACLVALWGLWQTHLAMDLKLEDVKIRNKDQEDYDIVMETIKTIKKKNKAKAKKKAEKAKAKAKKGKNK